jgi:hypothetical protein
VTKNITSTLCEEPIRDRTAVVSVVGVVGGVIAVIAFVLRMISRLPRFGGQFGMDDAVMMLAIVSLSQRI